MICAVCGRDGRGMGFNLAMAWTTQILTIDDHQKIQGTEHPHYLVAACSMRCLDAITRAYHQRKPMRTNKLEDEALAAAARAAGEAITRLGAADRFKGFSKEDFVTIVANAVEEFTNYLSKNSPDIRQPMTTAKKDQ
jgi:hypothetical protein